MSGDSPIDRKLQRDLLLLLRSAYPNEINSLPADFEMSAAIPNLKYLEEHNLCKSGLGWRGNMINQYVWAGGAKITAQGLDFLEEDGGLSAILGIVTVKIQAD